MTIVRLFFFCVVCLLSVAVGRSDDDRRVKTFGGIFFWGDVLFDNDWHIQENVKTHSFRLLDGKSMQHTAGTFDECKERLNEIKIAEGLLPMSGSVVIVLHGFGSNANMLRKLDEYLNEHKTHDYVCCMSYPSTMQSILEHTRMLQRVINNLPPTVNRIDFIGHSLGSIVIRRYLSGPLDENWTVPANPMEYRKTFMPEGMTASRLGKFVMLGPPNHGAELASKFIGKDPLRRLLTGKSGDELGTDWDKMERTLGIPCCDFMIISGGKGDNKGYSSAIPNDDDGMVSTEGTKIDGAAQWKMFQLGHRELIQKDEVFDAVKDFLQSE